ncbi:class I SAM-dependent methyltransferase [Candidatus Vampirococcus lugosii]|uniref:S-adenosyl-L-methionine-dependent methyltransferase n=1 Tax=Candidatus Vampirococcus lugosii TaxID=2789015 RepID=A0ABS5QM86_9BACT|nr:class I SAM-dependent methyltransferase [Candidatus Vampirococcus lugosii]MBS8122312.1 S-adenosyl-L-methionine-dependent methyltransferase [Candidatus Vampirococcus lugosii]
MKKDILTSFFDKYSKNVDNADSLGFWKLSDAIIESIIQKHIDKLYDGKEFMILDAGCGTGRWIKKIINKNKGKKIKFIAYDLFDSMLNKAKENLQGYDNVKFIKGDLQDINLIEDNSIDLCISIYSPISFVDNSSLVIGQIKKILKINGEALIMGHAFHNAIDSKINNYMADKEELSKLNNEQLVKWNDMLPYLNTYSIETFEELGKQNGLNCVGGYGVTIYLKPQNEDWDPNNSQKSKISLKLEEDKDFFNEIYSLEMENNSNKTLVNRGLNILAFYKK